MSTETRSFVGSIVFDPYPWQLKDVETLRKNGYTGLLNIDPGGTKTAISTLAIKDSGADTVLISAPKSTFNTAWKPTVESILDTEARVMGNDLKTHKMALSDYELGYPGVYLTTPQFLARSDISNWRGDQLIVDEVHQVATARSKAQRKISGFSPKEDGEPLSRRFGARLALSGTPARQNFENMWSTMRLLWPDLYKRNQIADDSYFTWLQDRMLYEEVVTGFEWVPVWRQDIPNEPVRTKVLDGVLHWGKVSKAKKWLSEAEPGRLLEEAPCVITHFRRQRCCEWHPEGFLSLEEPQVIEHVVELAPAQKKAIRELETHYMTFLGDHPLVTELTLTQQQRIRQVCLGVPTMKLHEDGEATVEFERDCVSPFISETLDILGSLPSDEPVLIFLDSQRFASVVTERLNAAGISAAEYSGKTTKNREEYLRNFGKEYRVLVGVTSSIGTGTDSLQDKCNTEIWLEIPMSLTQKIQGESRLERMGQRRQIQRFIIQDDLGYSEGRIGDLLMKQLSLNMSLRKSRGE